MRVFEKREYAAYTIRPKIRKLLPRYLAAVPPLSIHRKFRARLPDLHIRVSRADIPELVASCDIDHTVRPASGFRGGSDEAEKRLDHFLETSLHRYSGSHNEPSAKATSGLSPYLHFGHISSLQVALAVQDYARCHKLIADQFLEELIVRRELAFNFACFTDDHESLDGLPD